MKTIILLCSFMFPFYAFAQDAIILKTTEEIKCKVLEITTSEVKYKRADNPDGPLISISKADVFMIKYENGKTESFSNTPSIASKTTVEPDMFTRGKKDAEKYYTKHKAAAGWTLATTLVVGGIGGIIPAVACSSTPPKEINLDYPNGELFKNEQYADGYKQAAKKKKSNKVWGNFAIGIGVNIIAFLYLAE